MSFFHIWRKNAVFYDEYYLLGYSVQNSASSMNFQLFEANFNVR